MVCKALPIIFLWIIALAQKKRLKKSRSCMVLIRITGIREWQRRPTPSIHRL